MKVVPPFGPVQAIVDLISVLDAILRSVSIRPQGGTEIALIHVHAGKLIQAWIRNIGHRVVVRITVEAKPQLIGQVRREVVIFGYRCQIVVVGDGLKESLRKTGSVDGSRALQDKTSTQLVFI